MGRFSNEFCSLEMMRIPGHIVKHQPIMRMIQPVKKSGLNKLSIQSVARSSNNAINAVIGRHRKARKIFTIIHSKLSMRKLLSYNQHARQESAVSDNKLSTNKMHEEKKITISPYCPHDLSFPRIQIEPKLKLAMMMLKIEWMQIKMTVVLAADMAHGPSTVVTLSWEVSSQIIFLERL